MKSLFFKKEMFRKKRYWNVITDTTIDMKPLPKEPDDERKKDKKMKTPKSNKSFKKDDKPVISPPSNFEHTVHVGFDPHTGEFTGMPESWARLLQSSNISKSEQKKNPQAVLDVLNYYESSGKDKQESKYMTNISKPLSSSGTTDLNSTRRPSLSEKLQTSAVISTTNTRQEPSPTPSPETEEDEDEPPPPTTARPDKTKSIYTKPIEEEKPPTKNDKPKKKKVPTATLR